MSRHEQLSFQQIPGPENPNPVAISASTARLGGVAIPREPGPHTELGYTETSSATSIRTSAANALLGHLDALRKICGDVDETQRGLKPLTSEIIPIDGTSNFITFQYAVAELGEIAKGNPVVNLPNAQRSGMNLPRAEYVAKIVGLKQLSRIIGMQGLDDESKAAELLRVISSGRLTSIGRANELPPESHVIARRILEQSRLVLTKGRHFNPAILTSRIEELKIAAGYNRDSKLSRSRTIDVAMKVLIKNTPARYNGLRRKQEAA